MSEELRNIPTDTQIQEVLDALFGADFVLTPLPGIEQERFEILGKSFQLPVPESILLRASHFAVDGVRPDDFKTFALAVVESKKSLKAAEEAAEAEDVDGVTTQLRAASARLQQATTMAEGLLRKYHE